MAKFSNLDDFYESLSNDCANAIKRFVKHVAKHHPEFELVLAWNQPMFRIGTKYIIGFMPTKNYVNLLTVSDVPITENLKLLKGYRHGGRSISVAFDWEIDSKVIDSIVASRLKELKIG